MKTRFALISVCAASALGFGCGDNINVDPDAIDQSVMTAEDTPVDVTLEGGDANGDTVTFSILDGPANGIVDGTAPNVTYTPNQDFFGADSFTFQASDGQLSSVGTVTVVVMPVNDAPVIVAVGDQMTDEDTDLGPITLMVSDVDNPVSDLVITSVSGDETLVAASGIVIVDNGAGPEMTITPEPNANGSLVIGLTVSDGGQSTDSDFDLTITPINDPPTIVVPGNQTTQFPAVGPLAFTVADIDDDAANLVVTAESDDVAILPNDFVNNIVFNCVAGTCDITLTPVASGDNEATVTLTVTDPGNASANDSFTLSVTNRPPTAVNDNFATIGNTFLGIGGDGVLGTQGGGVADSDADGDAFSIVAFDATSSMGGAVALNTATGAFDYTPPVGVTGVGDTFTYTLSDGFETGVGTVTVALDQLIWYVDNTASGNGLSISPLGTLAAAEAASGEGDVIYVARGDGLTTGQDAGITLDLDQKLIGQGVNLVVSGGEVTGIENTDLVGGEQILIAQGQFPIITNTAGAGVTLNDGNEIRGVNINEPAGLGLDGDSTASLVASLIVQNSQFELADGTSDHAMFIDNTNPSGPVSIDIIDNVFSGEPTDVGNAEAIRLNIGAGANNETAEIDIRNNFVIAVDTGILVDVGGSTGTGGDGPNQITIDSNSVLDFDSNGIDVGPDDTSDSEFFITNNTVDGNFTAPVGTLDGIEVRPGMAAGGVAEVTITGNTIADIDNRAIDVTSTGSTDAGVLLLQVGGPGALSNTIDSPDTLGVRIRPSGGAIYCATVDSNVITASVGSSLFEFFENAGNPAQPELQLNLIDNSDNVGYIFERTDDGVLFFGEDAASPRIGSQLDADVITGVGANGNAGTPTILDTTGGGTGNPITIIDEAGIPTPAANSPADCTTLQ